MGRNGYVQPRSRPPVRYNDAFGLGVGTLGVGTILATSTTYWRAIPIAGSVTVRVRVKTNVGCTVNFTFVGPDFQFDQDTATNRTGTAFGSLIGTQYATPVITAMTMVANTENKTDISPSGEGVLLISLSGAAGAGAISIFDVCQISYVG